MAGRLRSSPDDFEVVEELGFEPDGEGEHDFLWLEKRGANSIWVAEQLAGFAGVRPNSVGFSGLKDRHAITRQWFSVHRPAGAQLDWRSLDLPGVRVLDVTRNRRKLRRGAHRCNRFRIFVRDARPLVGNIEQRLLSIRERGVPNYFGEQRFGHAAGNLRQAAGLFAGARLSRGRRSLALSAARSWLFNLVLERRVHDATWDVLLPGEVANLDGSGSVFPVSLPDAELVHRAGSMDIHPTGPLFGLGESRTSGPVAALERRVIGDFPAIAEGLQTHGLRAARRPLRAAVRELDWQLAAEVLEVSFTLQRGVFATAVLRELVAYEAGDAPESAAATQ